MSDGLLLPDEPTHNEISRKQRGIEAFGKKLVRQRFIPMRNILYELANPKTTNLVNLMDEFNWILDEKLQRNYLFFIGLPSRTANTLKLIAANRYIGMSIYFESIPC